MTNQGFDDGEWQAQERARNAVREDAEPSGDEGADMAYRRIAQALREPPSINLPRDFATDVAKLASPSAVSFHAKADPELRIAGTLAGILVACCVVVGFLYAGTLASFLASPLGGWSFSALCCAAAAQGFQLLTKRMARDFEASLR